jgi:hypothetical protein
MVSLRGSEFFACASLYHHKTSAPSSQPFSLIIYVGAQARQLKSVFCKHEPGVLYDRGERRSVWALSQAPKKFCGASRFEI